MSLTVEKHAETDAIPDTLLQTLGVMRNVSRSMAYIEQRLPELGELEDLDPRLRREVRQLRGDMGEVTGQVLFRLSLMGTIIADLLKEADNERPTDSKPSGEAKRGQGRARKGSKRLEVVPVASI
jgi:hypothetical protein